MSKARRRRRAILAFIPNLRRMTLGDKLHRLAFIDAKGRRDVLDIEALVEYRLKQRYVRKKRAAG